MDGRTRQSIALLCMLATRSVARGHMGFSPLYCLETTESSWTVLLSGCRQLGGEPPVGDADGRAVGRLR
ncbi:hypothetical protein GQ600_22652 [Phytophthora cactorum]|nr:hypothetical protein GQ600_22652 [Phytophthora cactorum]